MERRGRRRVPSGETREGKKLTPPGILDLLGQAMGCMGMGYDDFCRLTFPEFSAIHKAYHEAREMELRDGWERMRAHAAITISPHLDKRHRITSISKLYPLPWDNEKKPKASDAPRLTPAEQRARAKVLMERLDAKKQTHNSQPWQETAQ